MVCRNLVLQQVGSNLGTGAAALTWGAPAAGAGLAPAKEIASRDDTDEPARIVHDGQHDPGRVLDGGVRRDGDAVSRHDLMSAYDVAPLL